MLVSWNWLKEYVRLDMSADALGERLMMAGLNLESVSDVEGDIAIDLEVTSNRPDCLCHLGVAREVGVLFERSVALPPAAPGEKGPAIATLTSVENRATDLCPQYSARLVRGVKVAPSPSWMQRRLTTLGIRPINNVVDVTNYVLMECGQPLHAFDFDKLNGKRIVVRRAAAGEKMTAIDQRVYELTADMCVIADASKPVAIAGVMGGLDTEIGERTTNVLVEVAEFTAMSVRATARKLHLHSDSSYRFERGIDRKNLDWASRRCAELILELAGGELCSGWVFAGAASPAESPPIVLRLSQIPRILGIDIPGPDVERILKALGLQSVPSSQEGTLHFVPPSWRRDLTREIDLIEEAARIHGYEQIPEDVPVPLEVSQTTASDKLASRLAEVLTGAGFYEAVTLSFVSEADVPLFRPWTDSTPLRVEHSSRQRENILRQSIVPSLLHCRRQNERHGTFDAQLFEIARAYLVADPVQPGAQPRLLSFVSGRSFAEMKGIVESLVDASNHQAKLSARPAALESCLPGRACELLVDGKRLGWLGEISDDVRKQLDLQNPVTAAEIDLSVLEAIAEFSPVNAPLPLFQGMQPDLNFLLDEAVTWEELEGIVRASGGPLLQGVAFESQYRGQQIPADKKSYVVRLNYRANDRTLTGEEVDAAKQKVIEACREKLGATLR